MRESHAVDTICDRFEAVWKLGGQPRIGDYLAEASQSAVPVDRVKLLIELVLLDLDYRWRRAHRESDQSSSAADSETAVHGDSDDLPPRPRLDDYVEVFSELGTSTDLPDEMIVHEYCTRCRWGDRPSHREYRQRFPDRGPSLPEALSEADRKLAAPEADPPLSGRLGRFEVVELLGRGGMGTVYKAKHTMLKRDVALKVLSKELTEDAEAVARFQREMEAVGRLDHPHLVRALDADVIENMHVLVMDFVEGHDLGGISQRIGQLPVAEACEVVRQAALGLQYAHEHGLIHRDIKPSNLMLSTSGEQRAESGEPHRREVSVLRSRPSASVRILDLGLAMLQKQTTEGDELTKTGQLMGTLDYVAPEQTLDSRQVDARTDIYSLGCTLYRFLVGRAPFAGPEYDTVGKKIVAHVHAAALPVQHWRQEVPDALAEIVHRMIAKDPADRYTAAVEVADALAPFATGADLTVLLGPAAAALGPHTDLGALETASCASATSSDTDVKPEEIGSRSGQTLGEAAPQARTLPSSAVRNSAVWKTAIGLLLMTIVGLAAWHIIIHLKKDERVTTLRVPEGSDDNIGKDGRKVEVWLDGDVAADPLPARQAQQLALLPWAESEPPPPPLPQSRSSEDNFALQYNGAWTFVWLPVTYDGTHPITLEANVSPQWPQSEEQHVVGNAEDGGLGIVIKRTDQGLQWQAILRDGDDWLRVASDTAVRLRQEQHVAAVWDGNSVRLYIDGRLQLHRGAAASPNGNSPFPFLIGASPTVKDNSLSAEHGFTGRIDEVRISRIARYTGDFNPQRRFEPDEHTIALYHFDESAGSVAYDASGNDHHGRVVLGFRVCTGIPDSPPELMPKPANLPGIARWQMETVGPRRAVYGLSWSPDGRLVAYGVGTLVHVYDAAERRLECIFPGALEGVMSTAFSPDGKLLAASDDAGTIRLWDPETGRPGPMLVGHEGRVKRVAWHPSGKQLASCCADDKTVRLWNIDGAAGPVWRSGEGPKWIDWSPDGKWLAVADGNDDGLLRIVGPDRQHVRALEHGANVEWVAFSPDGRWLASGGTGLRVWSTTGWELARVLHNDGRYPRVAWSPDSDELVDARGHVWTLEDGSERGQFWTLEDGSERHIGDCVANSAAWHPVAWSPQGDRIAFGVFRGTVRFWNVAESRFEPELGRCLRAPSLAWSPNGRWLVSATDESVRLWDTASGKPGAVLRVHEDQQVRAVSWNPIAEQFASGSDDGKVYVWNLGQQKPDLALETEGRVDAVAWRPDGRALAADGDTDLFIWNPPDPKPRMVLQTDESDLFSVAWSPNMAWIAAGEYGGGVQVWSADDGKPVAQLDMQGMRIAFSSDSQWLAGVGRTGRLKLIRTRDWTQVTGFPAPTPLGCSLTWSPDAQQLAVGNWRNRVQFWQVQGHWGLYLRCHISPVPGLAWSPEGDRLATGGEDSTIRIWDTQTGAQQWLAALLPDGRAATFNATGEMLSDPDPEVDEQLIYVIQRSQDGPFELMSPQEFREFVAGQDST